MILFGSIRQNNQNLLEENLYICFLPKQFKQIDKKILKIAELLKLDKIINPIILKVKISLFKVQFLYSIIMPRLKKRRRVHSVPMFIGKLAKMLSDQEMKTIIAWNQNGDKFIIKSITKFVTDVLPKFYKHNNLASFIRQLNMHNFHKVKDEENSKQANVDAYSHPKFLRDQPALFKQIKRKSQKRQDTDVYISDDIRQQMDKLKKRQDNLYQKYDEIILKSAQLIEINLYLADQLKKLNTKGVQKPQKKSRDKSQIKEEDFLVNQLIDYSNYKYLQNKNFGLDSFMDVDQQLNPKQTLQMMRDKFQDQI